MSLFWCAKNSEDPELLCEDINSSHIMLRNSLVRKICLQEVCFGMLKNLKNGEIFCKYSMSGQPIVLTAQIRFSL
jgi:hypothetical protein